MRITGRVLRPSNLAERRILKLFGLDHIRCPRRHNPFAVARLVRRMSLGGPDMQKLQRMLKPRSAPPPEPQPVPVELPDSQSTPREADAA
jgi:hypothetical protein